MILNKTYNMSGTFTENCRENFEILNYLNTGIKIKTGFTNEKLLKFICKIRQIVPSVVCFLHYEIRFTVYVNLKYKLPAGSRVMQQL